MTYRNSTPAAAIAPSTAIKINDQLYNVYILNNLIIRLKYSKSLDISSKLRTVDI